MAKAYMKREKEGKKVRKPALVTCHKNQPQNGGEQRALPSLLRIQEMGLSASSFLPTDKAH